MMEVYCSCDGQEWFVPAVINLMWNWQATLSLVEVNLKKIFDNTSMVLNERKEWFSPIFLKKNIFYEN